MRFISAALIVSGLICANAVMAQETTGRISGRVVDTQGLATPAATVTVTGPQGAKTATTDSGGRFSIPFLTPGVYVVRAELKGFKGVEQPDVIVSVGQTVDLALKLEVGVVAETIRVQASSPIIDTSSTTIGARVSTDAVNDLPVGRTFSDVLYLAPGVSSSGSLGRSNPSIGGASGLENLYIVDGASVTNTGYGGLGSYSLIFGSLGNSTPYDFIKDIEIKTGGYEAEFGQATGGVVNVITKSGSNAYRGSAFAYSQPDFLEGAWTQYQSANGSVQTVGSQVNDVGAEGGGPIMKNRLFFFGPIDPSWQTRTLHAPAGFALESLGDVDRNRRVISYAAKGTFEIGNGHRVDASFFGDPSHGELGPQRLSSLLRDTTSGFSTLDYGGHQQAVRYDGILGSHWLLQGSFARSLNDISELPSVDTWAIEDQTVTPTLVTGGIGRYEKGNHSLNHQYSIKASNLLGGHQLKYGFQYDDVFYSQLNNVTGPTFTGADGRTTATGAQIIVLPDPVYGKIYRVTRANYNLGHDTTQTYYDLFVQDTWRVSNRLTINPGLRYDHETMSGDLITGWQLKNNWGPRIGVTYDLTGDGKTKVYGNYGVFFARIPNDLAARSLSADDGYTRGDYFDAGLTQIVPDGVLAAGKTTHFILAGVGVDTLDPNAKLSYQNEYVLGIEREIMPNTSFGVRYIHRDFGRVLEDVANAPMAAYEIGVPGLSSVEYILTNPTKNTPVLESAAFLGASFDDPVHRYNALEVTLNKRGGNWSAVASYRYSRLRGNFEGFYRNDNGQSDPGITSLYDFPTNDPSYVSIGVPQYGFHGDIRYLGDPNGILPLDRPHQVKLYGNYSFATNLNVGLGVNLSNGSPMTPFAANPNYDSAGEIPEAARGTGIQTVDGFRTRTPFESQIDLQASYALRLAGGRKLTFVANVFNLFNERRVTFYDQATDLDASTINPDFGKPINTLLSGSPPQYQAPGSFRVGIRFEF